ILTTLPPPRAALVPYTTLFRSQTDRVDLYYAHHDDETQTAQQLARTFDRLVQDGKVGHVGMSNLSPQRQHAWIAAAKAEGLTVRSEEHTSELQSRFDLVCRLLL